LLTSPQRNFTVVAHTPDSITFSIVDPDDDQGFPGEVISYITYTMTPYQWHIKMVALSTIKKTPIMLSSHVSVKALFGTSSLAE
jgi:aldose 1-epimerase